MRANGKFSIGTYSKIGLVLVIAAVLLLETIGVAGASTPGFGGVTCTTVITMETGTNVQTAISSASSGAVICLDAGVYTEQLYITQPLTLVGQGTKTIIEPTTVSSPAADYDTGQPIAPIIWAQGATNVNIKNLEINGALAGASSFDSCVTNFVGILYQDSSGTIAGTTVNNVELSTSLFGCQDGLAIFVQSDTATLGTSTVNIQNNTVINYDKNGITCNDKGTNCNIINNIVTGIGQTTLTAQNGVQIAYGATGTVNKNQVSGDSYVGTAPATSGDITTICPTENYFSDCYQAGGILLYDAPNVVVSNNKVSLSDIGIAVSGDGTIPNSKGAANDSLNNNIVQGNYGYGAVFDGFNGTSANNNFQKNPVGLLVTDYFATSYVTSINDLFLNNVVNNEAIDAGYTPSAHENLVVETKGLPFIFPKGPHHFHFGE